MGYKFGFNSYNFDIKQENYDKYYLFRYFPSLNRLESFLTKGIYMTRADKFSDQLECVDFNNLVEISKRKNVVSLLPEHNPHMDIGDLQNYINKTINELDEIAVNINNEQQKYHISCWYISQNQIENELMWKSYGTDHNNKQKGFLIRISLKDLMSNMIMLKKLNPELSSIVFGSVAYYDFNNEKNIQKIKYTGFRKHSAFKDESEFRLIYKNENLPIKDDIFLKLSKSFYNDISIIAHPDYDLNDYHKIRRKIETDFEQSVQISELYIWYKLKNRLQAKDKLVTQ
ncbi:MULTISPECIES: DUF2971 domain-containing protein [Sphingobacterium]|uniref:DUF2971 domain-containing protein n=1 Tax=Sphingobacterium TaxID=28453 RepID=UPI00104CAC1A|nr:MULTISPECIES: DUF2971 domain-containing protein [Sphingobacterium]MCW2258684.1 hypothetical protein [Sphingobacterium kitahiroshimense]TCR14860.1 DUF2971 family protein [Sphingobacterium sp. JUb78]